MKLPLDTPALLWFIGNDFQLSAAARIGIVPVVVPADAGRGDWRRGDWILCQIISKPDGDTRAIKLDDGDFATGSLRLTRFVRPDKLFTAHATVAAGEIGKLNASTFAALHEAVKQVMANQ